MKVVLEIAAMAADAGLVRTDEDVICIGGTGRGADTAVVLQPNYVHHNGRDQADNQPRDKKSVPRFLRQKWALGDAQFLPGSRGGPHSAFHQCRHGPV